MNRSPYDEEVETHNLAPAAPTMVWGALMAVALIGAVATVMRSSGGHERLVASTNERGLQSDAAKLSQERDDLSGRLAALERSFGQYRLATRASGAPETTGSIARAQTAASAPAAVPYVVAGSKDDAAQIGVLLGRDGTADEVRRRWASLAARYPQQLGRLSPRSPRNAASGLFGLVAGPFATRAEASRTCAALADAGLACDTTGYAGDPIGRP